MMQIVRAHFALVSFFFISFSLSAYHVDASPKTRFDCEPCIDRSTYSVRMIAHGTSTDPFWQQVHSSAKEAAMNMNTDFSFKFFDSYDTNAMSKEIEESTGYNALIVTIPDSKVKSAVEKVVNADVPVFGFHSGASIGKNIGVLDFIEPDNQKGGEVAAERMTLLRAPHGGILRALFVNEEKGNLALDKRLNGFQSKLGNQVEVTELPVDVTDISETVSEISEAIAGCRYDAVLLSGTGSLVYAIAAYEDKDCSFSTMPLGAFDTSKEAYHAIANDKLSFIIGQQQALQGALAVYLASLYASTGKTIAKPRNGAYITGPQLIEKATLPSDTLQVCEQDAFPVCPNNKSPNGEKSVCQCIDRKKVKIGGVTHGRTTDSFWDPVYAASLQASLDMNVELINKRFKEDDESVLHVKMANQIEVLCTQENVDGLFVSIPSDVVVPAIEKCKNLNIPVMSINSGAKTSKSLNLPHHIGMLEYDAGFGAGEQLVKSGIKNGICTNHAKGVSVVEERCKGFGDALQESNIAFVGQVYVPDDNDAQFIAEVESFVAEKLPNITENWDGLGILAAGGPQHTPAIELARRHFAIKLGAFDTSSELYDAVDAGIKEFGIDQQPYLQGYMPVLLLTYMSTTGQTVSNRVIESGPAFIKSSPTKDQVICEENFFKTCTATEENEVPVSLEPSSSSTLPQTWPLYLSLFSFLLMTWVLFSL